MKYITEEVTGYCPEQDCEHTINVNYHLVSVLGASGYKKGAYKCSYMVRNTCTQKICPILKNAPKNPN
ncbi:MAG: hypothetical protein LKF87_03765 [Clostridium tyrobutyricum]|jgi:hypothetical protein|uniref:hypothetical protein n=1 Tax=Clostridium tyrobutyricum TaxID=1519 RepID=UPI001C384C47|nr:hypothetical protein [Clostridium tyrobutyricum]MBV4447434.1 hypothetical protein [Clostridium tyrobutyricum]MCH4199280.1 hypothetical protein [Clostridium tyrobutyricum]MCH4236612.1 hypothetical protein [Clostridium tyrobutyricum]MCH4258072.1 hypothetical protein [Clostridium tyrobutyricum]MCI1239111.1 hypothetical protein [Clostridium tyrobutyricum]